MGDAGITTATFQAVIQLIQQLPVTNVQTLRNVSALRRELVQQHFQHILCQLWPVFGQRQALLDVYGARHGIVINRLDDVR